MRKENIVDRFPKLKVTQDELVAFIKGAVESISNEHPEVAESPHAFVKKTQLQNTSANISIELFNILASSPFGMFDEGSGVGSKLMMQFRFILLRHLDIIERALNLNINITKDSVEAAICPEIFEPYKFVCKEYLRDLPSRIDNAPIDNKYFEIFMWLTHEGYVNFIPVAFDI